MTETVTANGPEGGNASQTTATTTTVIANQGSNGDSGIKVAGPLNEDNRALVAAKKWAKDDGTIDLNEIANGYRNLETHASKSLRMPDENATAEDWNAFYSKLGRPETADKYELKLNTESVPSDFPYDEKIAIEFRNWAHEAGLSPKQAQLLHDKFVGYQAGAFSSSREEMAQKESDAHRDLVREWGVPESEGYKRNVEMAARAMQHLDLKGDLVALGALSNEGAIRSPKLAKALAKIGAELYAEDSMATMANGVISNPFSDAHFNLSKQGELVRSDPRKAKALIAAAGKNPAQFGL